jgi:hypothetical protein
LPFIISKRPTVSSEDCGNMKRKPLPLSVKQKAELLMKIKHPENLEVPSSPAFWIRDLVLLIIYTVLEYILMEEQSGFRKKLGLGNVFPVKQIIKK